MIREQAKASRWAIHSTRSSAIIKLLAMLTITSPSWCPNTPKKDQLHGPTTGLPKLNSLLTSLNFSTNLPIFSIISATKMMSILSEKLAASMVQTSRRRALATTLLSFRGICQRH